MGQWSAANRQGQVAGANAAGGNAVYETADIPYILLPQWEQEWFAQVIPALSGRMDLTRNIKQNGGLTGDKFNYSKLVFRNGLFAGFILCWRTCKIIQ